MNDSLIDGGVEFLLASAALKVLPRNQAGKRVHANTLYRWIASGRIEARFRRVGQKRRWYVRRDQVEAMCRLEEFRPVKVDAVKPVVAGPRLQPTLERMQRRRD